MIDIDRLREARRECPNCEGPCISCGIDEKYILIFYNSLWRECPDCRGLGILAKIDRACDNCGGSGDNPGLGLVPLIYEEPLMAVGPILMDLAKAGLSGSMAFLPTQKFNCRARLIGGYYAPPIPEGYDPDSVWMSWGDSPLEVLVEQVTNALIALGWLNKEEQS